jgi:hypothetical protein
MYTALSRDEIEIGFCACIHSLAYGKLFVYILE